MNHSFGPKSPDRSFDPEQDTNRRYNLGYDLIGSTDLLIKHPAGFNRVIKYPKGNVIDESLRDKLISKDLILGRIINDDDDDNNEQVFLIPRSSRPLAYDSTSSVEGSYSYNDRKLFYDLGFMLATAVTVDPIPHVIKGEIGRAIAIVDFAKERERQLFFIPGIERILEPINAGVDPLDYYLQALQEEFGARFQNTFAEVRIGFVRGMNEERQ